MSPLRNEKARRASRQLSGFTTAGLFFSAACWRWPIYKVRVEGGRALKARVARRVGRTGLRPTIVFRSASAEERLRNP